MLTVYFTARTKADAANKKNYHIIIKELLRIKGIKIISDTRLTDKKNFTQEKALIDRADIIIAEITQPSTDVGGEIVYALTKKKSVLALVLEDNDDALTPMLAHNPSDNLFIEHYSHENVHLKLEHFFSHIQKIREKKGTLIVIDGGDGSGKATQAKLLISYLKKKKIPIKYMDFPQYYSSFFGNTVAMFLRGEFGELNTVSPYLASLAYAADRASVKEEMEEFLSKGGVIIANRYATSNMAHQAARIHGVKAQKAYLKWVFELEYKVNKIPREDTVIYLYVPWKVGFELTKNKIGRNKYLKGKAHDIAEADMKHRQDAEKMYLTLARENPHWKKINCFKNGKLLSIDEIHQKILAHLTF